VSRRKRSGPSVTYAARKANGRPCVSLSLPAQALTALTLLVDQGVASSRSELVSALALWASSGQCDCGPIRTIALALSRQRGRVTE